MNKLYKTLRQDYSRVKTIGYCLLVYAGIISIVIDLAILFGVIIYFVYKSIY